MELEPEIYRKQCKRYDGEYSIHYLTFSCFRRQPFLKSDRARNWLLESLDQARSKHPFDLWAYVIMPEHVHLILWPRRGAGVKIRKVLSSIKLPVTLRVLAWVRENAPWFIDRMTDRQPNGDIFHRFWQRGGGYDRNLRSVSDIYEKIHYVHHNPVHRRLVDRPEDWIWSSCRTFYFGEPGPIQLNLDSLPPPPVT